MTFFFLRNDDPNLCALCESVILKVTLLTACLICCQAVVTGSRLLAPYYFVVLLLCVIKSHSHPGVFLMLHNINQLAKVNHNDLCKCTEPPMIVVGLLRVRERLV